MTTVNIPGIELLKTGQHNASTGPVQITKTDLLQMAAASRDATLDLAHIKLGHIDPRFDGEPSLGQVGNLRVSSDGQSLIGDYINVPSALADILTSAYPERSVEIAWGQAAPNGEKRGAVLTGLALLGVTPPAVKGLADVYRVAASTTTADGVLVEVFSDTQTVPPAAPAPGEPEPASTTPEGTPMTVQTPAAPAVVPPVAGAPVVTPELDAEGNPITPTEPVTTEPAAAPATVAASGTVVVDAAVFAQLSAGAAAGVDALTQLDEQRREGIISAALSAGQITPDSAEKVWRPKLDEGGAVEAATIALLATLSAGIVPTAPIGHALSETGDDPRWATFEDSLIGKDN